MSKKLAVLSAFAALNPDMLDDMLGFPKKKKCPVCRDTGVYNNGKPCFYCKKPVDNPKKDV